MADKKKRKRRTKPEITNYIALVERTALSYGINHYRAKWTAFHPYSRSLHLYGRMVYPEPLAGARMNALLSGNPSLMEMPDGNLERGVATLHKYGKEFHFFAQAPVEFISTLSKAYSDNRLQVFSGRGPALFRGVSVLINIGFQDRRCFEEDWGEPLEQPCE